MSSPNFDVGPADRDLYLKAGGVPYIKLSAAGVLSPINGGSISGTSITNASLVAAGIGAWTSVPYSAADYTGSAGTWTVEAADASSPIAYARIGNVLFIAVYIATSSVASAGVALQIPLTMFGSPSVVGGNNAGSIWYSDAGTFGSGTWIATATHIQFLKATPSANWTNSTNLTDIRAQITLHIG